MDHVRCRMANTAADGGANDARPGRGRCGFSATRVTRHDRLARDGKSSTRLSSDTKPDKRRALIDQLLADERWADHWMSYWQDLLAENPTLINATSNSTGPFRWYLFEALRDDKPLDRIVTELMMMRGSPHEGGSAGFAMAAQNDSPYAAKGHILASAFLGLELQCARCHDSPYHSTKQKDLYSLAAMLERKPVTVPKTSTVPPAFFEKKARESLIQVTLKPGEVIQPLGPLPKSLAVLTMSRSTS